MNQTNVVEVLKLSVSEDQLPFVGTVGEILNARSDGRDFHVVALNDEIIGFFIADTAYYQQYDFASRNEVGLRGFLIDRKIQGRGYGTTAAGLLGAYITENYPESNGIVLTVNCKNPAAYNCYKKAGFTDANYLYYGGTAGPQNIMRMKLQNPP